MTLLIALIANSIHEHVTGEQFIHNAWIIAFWVFHVAYHAKPSIKKKRGRKEMKICAESPSNPEYSLCGNAFDASEDPMCEDMEPFRFAKVGDVVSCKECRRVIVDVRICYPRGFKCVE